SGQTVAARIAKLRCTLGDLGLSVSTGRVVDFRARDYLRAEPDSGTVPLIYPTHFKGGYVAWPKAEARKPNALLYAQRTRDLLVPNEHYVLTKRFSAKEEKKRIVAVVYDAERVPGTSIGFENHINYFHRNGKGLSLSLAKGLAAY